MEDERLWFVARQLDGERMTALCAEFGISRKTGDKIYDRYKEVGLQGLTDRSRRPYRHANQLPMAIEKTIVRLKREYPNWGAPKIRERLRQRCPEVQCPAISTVHAVLDRHGLVTRRKRRRHRAEGTALSHFTVFERTFQDVGLRVPFVPITASRLPALTRSTASASCRCGGYGSGSRLSASVPDIPSRTDATSGCTSR
ncbi:MAG TPA: helix-turn-helix domain-containing protein [Vicinamibacterales bacterium]|nr:helix-turn-helix domain-containing protein [Vicinamibacterales bacterium]